MSRSRVKSGYGARMLVVTRYRVPEPEQAEFLALAGPAVEALAAQAGCTGAWVGRNVDDAELCTLTTTWVSVGAYRRALGAYPVKLHAVPLMYRAIDEPSAYEDLLRWSPETGLRQTGTDRAADADQAAPHRGSAARDSR